MVLRLTGQEPGHDTSALPSHACKRCVSFMCLSLHRWTPNHGLNSRGREFRARERPERAARALREPGAMLLRHLFSFCFVGAAITASFGGCSGDTCDGICKIRCDGSPGNGSCGFWGGSVCCASSYGRSRGYVPPPLATGPPRSPTRRVCYDARDDIRLSYADAGAIPPGGWPSCADLCEKNVRRCVGWAACDPESSSAYPVARLRGEGCAGDDGPRAVQGCNEPWDGVGALDCCCGK